MGKNQPFLWPFFWTVRLLEGIYQNMWKNQHKSTGHRSIAILSMVTKNALFSHQSTPKYPLEIKHGVLENPQTEWSFLARNITDNYSVFSSTACLMTPVAPGLPGEQTSSTHGGHGGCCDAGEDHIGHHLKAWYLCLVMNIYVYDGYTIQTI